MRIAILGVGAIGGYLGVKLARAGAETTFIARGAHLQAIERDGLALESADGGVETARPAR
jgi:2-dehydropantoate 2-reductase